MVFGLPEKRGLLYFWSINSSVWGIPQEGKLMKDSFYRFPWILWFVRLVLQLSSHWRVWFLACQSSGIRAPPYEASLASHSRRWSWGRNDVGTLSRLPLCHYHLHLVFEDFLGALPCTVGTYRSWTYISSWASASRFVGDRSDTAGVSCRNSLNRWIMIP